MGRPKSHQRRVTEILAVEIGRLHRKACGKAPPADVEETGEAPPDSVELTQADLDRLEVLARINKLVMVQLPKLPENERKTAPADAKAALAALERQLHGKDIQSDTE